MYILYQGIGKDEWQAVGYFAEFADAVCAMEEELKKKDGNRMKIEREVEHGEQE